MRSKSRLAAKIAMASMCLTVMVCTAATAVASSAHAAEAAPEMAYVPAPTQFVAFCERYPGECSPQAVRPISSTEQPLLFAPSAGRSEKQQAYDWSRAFATPAERPHAAPELRPMGVSHDQVVATLGQVNSDVNLTVRFRTDEMQFGKTDYWSLPVRGTDGQVYGDCEDFALQKRKLLMAAGFDANALSLAVVRTQKGEVHAILLVATEAGEMVLDNLSSSVTSWSQSRYRLIARQVAGDTNTWAQPA